MQFDFRKILQSQGELAKLDASLDQYLALEGDALSRLRFKRKGAPRDGMLRALAQMAMLFAAANMGSEDEYAECLADVVAEAAGDDATRRAAREFYLRNVAKVPGTLGAAVGRLASSRSSILGAPMAEPDAPGA